MTAEQIEYAAADVAWLQPLKEVVVVEAEQRNLLSFVYEEQAALSNTVFKTEVKDNFLKTADTYNLSPKDQYVLNRMFQFRDEQARKINKPAFQTIDEVLLRSFTAGTISAAQLTADRGVHRSLKNGRFAEKISKQLEEVVAAAVAMNLSDKLPGKLHLSAAQHAERELQNRDKVHLFAPIQQALAARFGTYAARFIFSNNAVSELLTKTIKISDIKRPYRRELLRDIAKELNLDLSRYEA